MLGERTVRRWTSLVPLVLVLIGLDLFAARQQYQFEGKVEFLEARRRRRVSAVVFLEGVNTPYSTKALAGPKGQFKFKNLDPGVYRLVIRVPRQGRMEQTVNIGPSFADRKGRIKATFDFLPQRRLASTRTVPLSQLSISKRARDALKKAEERLARQDPQGAVKYLRLALEESPEFAAAWNRLGTVAYSEKELVEAERYFRKALEFTPRAYEPTINLGGVLLSAGKLDQALEINTAALEIRPEDPLPYSRMGKTLFALGRLKEAEHYLKRAKLLDAGHYSYPGLYLAEICRRRKDRDAFVRELEEFLTLHPDVEFAEELRQRLELAQSQSRP